MATLVAATGLRWVLNHSRGTSRDMYAAAVYDDVVREVSAELLVRVHHATDAGVDPGRLILDPGLGFAKRAEHNWTLLAQLDNLVALGFPVLVGASRKRFLAGSLAGDGAQRPADKRDAATLATTVLAAQAGAWGVRVHDVASSADAVRVVSAVRQATGRPDLRRQLGLDQVEVPGRASSTRALARSSAYSAAGREPQVIPPPVP
jgi:dihydropteroate synthase